MAKTDKTRLSDIISDYTDSVTMKEFHSAEFDENFADYLLNNGVILPPCKIGDTVYALCYKSKTELEIRPAEVWGFSYDITSKKQDVWLKLVVEMTDVASYSHKLMLDEFVFLTREEAEKALKTFSKDLQEE